ncbi:hypothetical protein PROFUN_08848 [Planoprotostelium fungivorum]|uniref:protein-tyrosine-phosphatase n=1 Tax=Planoprotostelium fungivorum TaxID=1890364 RepID=A0A2P6NIZ3_9EUKA|nr:hypothetical protein PROFUN_08848 [Planoprotostelium fungivorum]
MGKIDCDEILPFLFLGSAKASKDADGLHSMGITHILNIAGRSLYPEQFVYKRSFFKDTAPLPADEEDGDEDLIPLDQLRDIFQWMDEVAHLAETSKVKLFVHCMAGMSRSPSIVIGWLVWSKKMDLAEAYRHVKERRPRIRPRILQQVALIEAERWNRQPRPDEEIAQLLNPKKGKK